MFDRPWHRTVYTALQALNARLLKETCCYFGGGTRIVMELGEYRESLDIDLLCADSAGYRRLRSEISENSLGAILTTPIELAREVRADRYGIRTFFQTDGSRVKFEIVLEGRIHLAGAGDVTKRSVGTSRYGDSHLMTPQELTYIISQGENSSVEFKESAVRPETMAPSPFRLTRLWRF